ncbi:MAG: metallophosphoesterase [Bryobacterales bacterium]|nr:metallophosphoesterase [Bryobacterales bacterium]
MRPRVWWKRAAAVWLPALLLLGLSGCYSRISDGNRGLPFAPAEVELQTPNTMVRVLVLGDFGQGSGGQRDVARAIANVHAAEPFDFGVTVGDNFYERGVSSVADAKWHSRWEEPYGNLGFPIYPTLGNHDYYGDVQAQLDYESPSNTWRFPARQYVLRSELVDLVAIDTMDPRAQQYGWLNKILAESKAHWKIVYGHHPIFSAGYHGDNELLETALLPLLRGRAAIYLAGHDHDLQHFKPIEGTHFVISGGGGARLRQLRPDPRTLFAQTMYGFTRLEIDEARIHLEMFDRNGKRVYDANIREQPDRDREKQTAGAEAPTP